MSCIDYKRLVKSAIELSRIQDVALDVKEPVSDELMRFCNDNGLGAWCFAQCQQKALSGVGEAALSNWKSVYFLNTINYQRYLAVFNKISKYLSEAGIPVIALKGIALASHLYKDDGLRPMGDIDILVPEGMGMKALEVILQTEAEPLFVPRSPYHEQSDAHVRGVKVDGIMVEIHQRLFSLGSDYYTRNVDFFTHTVEIEKQGIKLKQLDAIWMGYHLIAHAVKGIEMGGLRLGWLLDIALLIHSQQEEHSFLKDIFAIKPEKKKEMQSVIDMALLLLPNQVMSQGHNVDCMIDRIAQLVQNDDHSKSYRWINLRQLLKVPGFSTKVKLLWYEFFPQKAYMRFRYQGNKNEPLWRIYIKRIIRR
ncbi:nucleotidyltransferase family protein [Carboxylicivirga sp. A043]|uniref:nucleotidyltransferase family protein n=1 Tax=Carboxylicivirga litoralis TaxID=2816963 RepID=UPI0021CB18EE|nr:nucleotidyltransferase family protein [Carboxylicivirga sp. A043]MCU4155585.1 nucleotidyltransferase family protein [Carboxylicivirga sp. A043]